jgi:AraC-like DNA-binding protein
MPGSLAENDREAAPPDREATTPLADALSRLHLQGAIFLRGEYTEAWAYESIPGADATALLAPGASRVLLFHVIASGRAWIEVPGGERHWANSGDVIVLPYGDQHLMGGTAAATPISVATLIAPPPWDEMPVIHHGQGGEVTNVVCGYLTCEDAMFDPRLRVFPPVFVVSPPDGPARDWVRPSIEYAVQQTAQVASDRFEAPPQIPELLLVEILKLHLSSAPAADDGWARAITDPVLRPALAAIHASPEEKWSVGSLAAEANVSISLLDERFREVLGLAPIRYLTGWRMHVAEDLLHSSDLGVATVARRVGYASEAAFSRAFKRMHGQAPSVWRVQRHRPAPRSSTDLT